MFSRLGALVVKRKWLVVAVWIAIASALRLTAPSWTKVALDGDLEQLPVETTSARGARLNSLAFPGDVAKSQIVLVFARSEGQLTPEDRQFALELSRKIEGIPDLPLVGELWTERTPVIGDMLKSPTGDAERMIVRLANDFMAVDNISVLAKVKRCVERSLGDAPPGLSVGATGSAAIGGDLLAAAKRSLRNTELTTIVLVVVVLLAIYRSPWLVAVPLACIALSTVVALDLLATLAQWSQNHPEAWPAWRVFTTTKIFVVVLLFGAGTDFCLFLIARFREAAARGASPDLASVDAVGRVGGAVAASALTTIVGLATMGLADFGKFAYSGPAIGASLAVALAACLTLGPALLATALGRRVAVDAAARGEVAEFGDRDEPLLGSASLARSSGVWSRIADVVVSRPGLVLTVSALVAAPLVWRGAHTEVTYDLFGELSPRATSRRGADLLMRHFPAGDVGPITVLAKLPAGSLADNEGRLKIAELAKHLHDLKGVSKVRSLYRPTGEPPGTVSVFSSRGLSAIAAAGSPVAEETFVARLPDDAGDVTRLFLVLEDSPFSERAMATCERVQDALEALAADQASPWHGAEFELLGTTPGICDLRRTTLADRRTIEISVTLSVLAVVMILLRRPIVSLLLVATVVIGYLATLGAIQLLLQWRLGTDYAGLDWKAPVFLFVILVAVGQDYNIYLVTRVFEEQRRLGGLAGLKEAMVRTGGIITSCGVIMAATFFSLTTGSLRGMVELGLALSLGILLDTFVVRTVVVPALLALLERLREPNRLAAAG